MIKINLISPEAVKKEERADLIFLAYFALAISIVICASNYIWKINKLNQIKSSLVQTEKELNNYENIMKQIETIQSTKSLLMAKKDLINNLIKGQLLYPIFLEELLGLLPGNISFKTLSTQTSPNNSLSITLNAEALDNYSIADLISSLSSNQNFNNVELGPIVSSGNQKINTSIFTLTFVYEKRKQQ